MLQAEHSGVPGSAQVLPQRPRSSLPQGRGFGPVMLSVYKHGRAPGAWCWWTPRVAVCLPAWVL